MKAKIRSQKTIERLQEKANKYFQLSECPRCGDEMDYGAYNYNSTDFESYFKCEKCGIRVTHIYDWHSTKIVLLKEG